MYIIGSMNLIHKEWTMLIHFTQVYVNFTIGNISLELQMISHVIGKIKLTLHDCSLRFSRRSTGLNSIAEVVVNFGFSSVMKNQYFNINTKNFVI